MLEKIILNMVRPLETRDRIALNWLTLEGADNNYSFTLYSRGYTEILATSCSSALCEKHFGGCMLH